MNCPEIKEDVVRLRKLRTQLLEGVVAGQEKAIKSFIDVGRHCPFRVES